MLTTVIKQAKYLVDYEPSNLYFASLLKQLKNLFKHQMNCHYLKMGSQIMLIPILMEIVPLAVVIVVVIIIIVIIMIITTTRITQYKRNKF